MLIRNWRFLIGLGVSLLLLLVLIYQVDLSEVDDALAKVNYKLYLAPSIALYFVAVYFRAVRWRYLLSPMKVLPVGRLYPVVVIGYMANNLLPARLGELVRAYYLARREPINASSALGTVAVERVYDGMTLLVRQLAPGPHGVPIEIYVFSNDTDWVNYEGLQSDIFDHIFAMMPEFGLRVFQSPSGGDIERLQEFARGGST